MGVALGASLVSWIIVGQTSPLANYFLWHGALPNLWRRIHTLPYVIVLISRPPILEEAIEYFLVFLQWVLIGYVLARLACRNR